MATVIQRVADTVLGRLGMPTRTELQEARDSLAFAQRQLKRVRAGVASGVEMTWGQYEQEFNAQFSGDAKWDTLEKMEADPRVKGAQRRHTLPLLTAEWEMEPASDKPRDKEIAEFCAANLLRKSSDRYGREYWLQTPWKSQRLIEILRMQRDGFSVFAKSHRRVGSKWVYDRLQWIEPHTVKRWILDESDVLKQLVRDYDTQTGMTRRAHYEEPIDAQTLKLYSWDMIGARYSGRSAWRSMFGAWFRKDFIQRVAIIWAQKVGAPIPVGVYPQGWGDEQRTQFEEFVQSMMGLEPAKAWGAFERGKDGMSAEVTYAGADGEPDRSTPLIDMENRELAQGMDTSSSMLGETESGSRALGASKGMVDMSAVEATAAVIAEQEAHGVGNVTGVIEELVSLNFGAVKEFPQLVAPKINLFERLGLVRDVVLPSVTAGIIPNHEDLRRQVTDMAGFSLPDDAFEEQPNPIGEDEDEDGSGDDTREGEGDEASQGDDAEEAPEPEQGATERAAAEAVRLAEVERFRERVAGLLQPAEEGPPIGGGFRRPTVLEVTVVNLAEVNRAFRTGERDALAVMRVTQRKMLDDLMGRLRRGKITARSVDTQRRSKPKAQKKAVAALMAVYTETGELGADHVDAELTKQPTGRR